MGNIVIESSITKSYQPDIVKFGIHIGKIASNSRELTLYNKSKIDEIVKGMDELNIDDDDLEETHFRISVNREYKDNIYIENGFKLDSGYTITTYLDYELMDSIREMLADLELEYNIDYALEDESEIRGNLLAEAVKNSKMKASIIARAAGKEVGDLVAVKYEGNNHRPVMMSTRMSSAEVAPEDIEITESVEVEWAIE